MPIPIFRLGLGRSLTARVPRLFQDLSCVNGLCSTASMFMSPLFRMKGPCASKCKSPSKATEAFGDDDKYPDSYFRRSFSSDAPTHHAVTLRRYLPLQLGWPRPACRLEPVRIPALSSRIGLPAR